MGWSYEPKPDNVKQSLIDNLTFENAGYRSRVLDIAIVHIRTAYAAVEVTVKDSGEHAVYGMVVLLDYRGENDPYNFGTKYIGEEQGPCETECPRRILDLLTAPRNKYAADWRAKCYDRLLQRERLPRLTREMYIRTYEPIRFVDGTRGQDFIVENARRVTLRGRNGRRYIVSRQHLNAVGYS